MIMTYKYQHFPFNSTYENSVIKTKFVNEYRWKKISFSYKFRSINVLHEKSEFMYMIQSSIILCKFLHRTPCGLYSYIQHVQGVHGDMVYNVNQTILQWIIYTFKRTFAIHPVIKNANQRLMTTRNVGWKLFWFIHIFPLNAFFMRYNWCRYYYYVEVHYRH